MSYSGTTSTSTNYNPPIQIARGVGGVNAVTTGGGGRGLWLYATSDESTNLIGTTYFTDAKNLGMKAGDVVISVHATGSSIGISIGAIGVVSTNGAGVSSTGSMLQSSR